MTPIRPAERRGPSRRGARLGGSASVLRKSREVALGRPVPAHAGDGVPPPVLHLVEGFGVRVVAARHHVLQMAVLGLDDCVGGITVQAMVARTSQLLACHGLHHYRPSYALS